jgi:hypothetical protein
VDVNHVALAGRCVDRCVDYPGPETG